MKISRKGTPLEVEGTQPTVGEKAPDFSLENLDGDVVSLESLKGQKVLISVFPDINTSVCDLQTRHFFNKAGDYKDVTIINISNNTKDQLGDWCATNNIDVEMLSDADLEFGKAYGIYVPEIDHLARSVFVVDEDGVLKYAQYLEEITDEPDYAEVFNAVEAL